MSQQLSRLFDLPRYQQAHAPQSATVAEKVGGAWKTYNTQSVIDTVHALSRGLLRLGIEPGDKVAIISNNRPQWNFADLAAQQIGAVVVPLYPTITEADYRYIFQHAEIRLAFVSDAGLLAKVRNISADVPTLMGIYSFDMLPDAPHWETLLEADAGRQPAVEALMAGIGPGDLATIIYTSGTTGHPKGVMLSHANILSNVRAVMDLLPIEPGMRALSFLPLCHVFERVVLYAYLYRGVNCYYAESLETIGDNLREVKPHFFTTVPRLLEKVYERIVARGRALGGLKRRLFFWAIRLGEQYEIDGRMGLWYDLRLAVARRLIFSKWQEALGGSLVGIVTGAAALNAKLCAVFCAAGIPVREGYGQTEASPAISINRFSRGDARAGTIGVPVPGVEVRIAENGEIIARGPNIMMGYYKAPEKTAEAVDAEGWLHTGDVGEWVGPGGKFLKITDRIKELFKTSGGKYVAPQPIENLFKDSFYVEQMMVLGENQKFVGGLIVPSFTSLADWCARHGVAYDDADRAGALSHPQVQRLFEDICAEVNANFAQYEQVKKFVLLPNEWTIEGGELTPTLKLKRKQILAKYAREAASLYA